MARVRLSVAALRDFDAIIAYLERVAGPRVAARYDRDIVAALDLLASFPGMGAPRPHLGASTRMVLVDPYLIYYDGEPQADTIRVLRIVHGRRSTSRRIIRMGRND